MIKKVKISEPELITNPDEIRWCNEILPLKAEICELQQENQQLKEKTEYLKSKIENKDRWCQLIADIGYDYDGYRDSENLMLLIDELVRYALNSRDNYDYEDFLEKGISNE